MLIWQTKVTFFNFEKIKLTTIRIFFHSLCRPFLTEEGKTNKKKTPHILESGPEKSVDCDHLVNTIKFSWSSCRQYRKKKTEVLTLLIVWTISGFFFIISGLISISEIWVIIFKHFGTSYRTKEINKIIKDYTLKQIQTMVSLSLTAWYMLFYLNNLNKLSLKHLFFQVRDKLKVVHSGKWKALLLIYILFFLVSIQVYLLVIWFISLTYFLSYLGFHCFALPA